jgi:hypothetical protein
VGLGRVVWAGGGDIGSGGTGMVGTGWLEFDTRWAEPEGESNKRLVVRG